VRVFGIFALVLGTYTVIRLGWYICLLPSPYAWIKRHRYISSLPLPEMVFDDDAGLFNDYNDVEEDDDSESFDDKYIDGNNEVQKE